MKIFTIVGARPNFIKIDPELKQTLVHTGQHYDYRMSQLFFKERKLPKPKWNLECRTVGQMIDRLKKLFEKEKPSLVLVFGDTNSGLAGALAAAYSGIPLAHIEAGLRSYNRTMPEEINRVTIDHLSTILLCPNNTAALNLLREGIKENVHIVGDPSFDAMNDFMPIKRAKNYQQYIFLTLHRNINVDDPERLKYIFEQLGQTKEKYIFPLHPRTKKTIDRNKLSIPENIKVTIPSSYKQTLALISNAKMVVTDSGGIQREAYWMGIPLVIIRQETEWIEIIISGSGTLAWGDIKSAIETFKSKQVSPPSFGVNTKIREVLYRYV